MSTDTKRYRLLKDLPDAKAGTELISDGQGNYDYKTPTDSGWYNEEYVENNPTWFELIEPSKEVQERIEVKIGKENWQGEWLANFSREQRCHLFFSSKEISEDKFPAIKQAIECILNNYPLAVFGGNIITPEPQPKEQADNSKPFVRQSKPMEEKDVVCHKQSPPLTDDKDKILEQYNAWEKELNKHNLIKDKHDWEIVTWFARDGAVASLISGDYDGNLKAGYTIRSVKRISDGCVFSVGDEIKWDGRTTDKIKIGSFFLEANKNMMASDKDHYMCVRLKDWQKLPQPTNVTTDKVTTDNSDVQILTLKDLKCILMEHSDGTYRGIENWNFTDNTMPENLYQSALQLVNQKLKQ